MKQVLSVLLYWSYIQISAPFPLEEKPGFTLWPLEKRGLTPLTELQYSGLKNTRLGTHFGIPDPTCRGKLPGERCWTMDEFTVDKMIDARLPKADECQVPCLFYTEYLSGAAERSANFVLWHVLNERAAEGPRKYQTIWDLHDRKYYPEKSNLDATPETKCAFLDREEDDRKEGHSGCQRLYFMSMSKAMAAECSGEVFLMTMTKLNEQANVPEDGIWWQVEFPTLIDEKRPENKKVTKITYLQVPTIDEKQLKVLQDVPEEERSPPEIEYQGEYWPNGQGQKQLEKSTTPAGKRGESQQKRSTMTSGEQDDSQEKYNTSTIGFVKRADRSDTGVCAFNDECYPFPYRIEDMYEWYKDINW